MQNNFLQQIELADLFDLKLKKTFFDPAEILDLHERYGPIDFFRAELQTSEAYFDSWHSILQGKKNRRAEVALCVANKNDEILLHTKPFYPPDIFRIPTGGIHPGEKVVDALHRELDEETGFVAMSFFQVALLIYEFHNAGRWIPFVSHIFKVHVEGNDPHPKDASENITGYRWIKTNQLTEIIHQLASLRDKWHDWGVMRSLPHDILLSAV